MIINYKPQEQELEIGRPYTYGTRDCWYMRVELKDVVFLGSSVIAAKLLDRTDSASHISSVLTWPEFRYATSMEIK